MPGLPLEMKIGFRAFGMQEARLRTFTMRTRVIKDLRLCGPQFRKLYACLATAYESEAPAPEEHMTQGDNYDCLFVKLGGVVPFFDRYIETPDITLGGLDLHLRG